MKKLLLLLITLPLFSFAQYGGNLQAYKVQTASYGATQNALLSLPDDYTSTSGSYPLIIFLHGYGEVGSTVQDLAKLTKQGLPQVVSQGKKIEAVNPLDGKLYKFIVLAPQHHGWTTTPEALEYMVSDLPKKFRIDTNRIYITGLSAGGQGVIQAVTYKEALTKNFAAIVPMSPSAPDDRVLKNFLFFSTAKTSAWFFSGNTDPGNYTDNARRYSDSISKYNPEHSKLSLYPGGHCCWATIYDPNYRENGVNIYEWMLTTPKGSPPPVIDPEPYKKTVTILHDPARIERIIILDKDGSWHSYDSTSYQGGGVKITMF